MVFKHYKYFFPFRSISTDCKSFYDVIIVGGGLVGNAMAVSLGNSPKFNFQKILVLETGKKTLLPTVAPTNYGLRVSAVNQTSINLFKKLGIWTYLTNYRTFPITDLYVMDSCSKSSVHFEQINNESPIAHVVENDAIVSALHDKIDTLENVTIKSECKVNSCNLPKNLAENATVTLANGEIYETSLLIGADGAQSQVRESMETNYSLWNYKQSAIVCSLEILSYEKETIAYQKFTPRGPIALLPLAKNLCSLVWTTSTEEANRLMLLDEKQFIDELNYLLFTENAQNSITNKTLFLIDQAINCLPFCEKRIKTKLRIPSVIEIQKNSFRASFPLSFGQSENYVTTRAALIGDAAHKVHPLAGQGVNLGWFDVQSLTECLEMCVQEGGDIGSTVYLKEYDNKSQKHNVPIMFTIDALNKLYSTDFPLFVFLRSFGLNALDKLLPIKDLIVNKAS